MNSENALCKELFISLIAVALLICLSACASQMPAPVSDAPVPDTSVSDGDRNVMSTVRESAGQTTPAAGGDPAVPGSGTENPSADPEVTIHSETGENAEVKTLKMKIGDTPVAVDWEENESVAAIAELVKGGSLTIQMSMYGGFEQVGALGTSLPRDDKQTQTKAGDIVLYSGNQIVVFYGSNSWSYTRLGHITDKTAEEMTRLLGNGDVTVTLGV